MRMSLAFIDREPTAKEIERLRLILSTYQDGTGMLADKRNPAMTLPGWRDFERSAALAFRGEAPENKAVFDVLLKDNAQPTIYYGLSCKMRGELNRIERDGRVTIELSNSSGKFWDRLHGSGINQSNYRNRPNDVGAGLLSLIGEWHRNFSDETGVEVDLSKSYFLVLSWNKAGWYQLHQFPLELPDPESLEWYCPLSTKTQELSRRVVGNDEFGTLFEWYGESGGQLKYYPLANHAIWSSERFRLEPLGDVQHGIIAKAAAYFPEQWQNLSE
jgi:hypothetical protein